MRRANPDCHPNRMPAISKTAHKVIKYRIVSFGFLSFRIAPPAEERYGNPLLLIRYFLTAEISLIAAVSRVVFLSLESVM